MKMNGTVDIPVGNVIVKGDLAIPASAHALVIFAHGSGSSRLSPRNQQVAEYLNSQGFATLLFDLLTYVEDKEFSNRFNISLLAERLVDATNWIEKQPETSDLRIGYFGASTGAAAALVAARSLPQVAAVVSRGGRPDLAYESLQYVQSPTLLLVGSRDPEVLMLNQKALGELRCEKRLDVVQGASHLFEEKGAIEKVSVIATSWFKTHLEYLEIAK
jgi:putative phosphoribosyl transferase